MYMFFLFDEQHFSICFTILFKHGGNYCWASCLLLPPCTFILDVKLLFCLSVGLQSVISDIMYVLALCWLERIYSGMNVFVFAVPEASELV